MRDYKPARKKKSRSVSKSRSASSSSKKRPTNQPKNKKKIVFPKFLKNFIVVILSLFLLLIAISLSLSYFFPLKSAKTIFLARNTNSQDQKVYLLRLVPSERSATLIELDSDKKVEVLGGYGEYKLQALYPLLKLEKKKDSFIRSALSLSLETIVDEVVVIPDNSILHIEDQKNLEKVLLDASYTKFINFTQFYKLFSYYSFVREASYDNQVPQDGEFSRGTKLVLKAETPESCPVAILNTTETRGLAGKIGEVFSNSGINVIRVDSDTERVEKSQIYFDDTIKGCIDLVDKTSQIIPNSLIEANMEISQRYRAGIVVLLGQDFSE